MSDNAAVGQKNGSQSIQWRERELKDLRPSDRNARTHSQRQIRQIADSISAFGNINPIIIDAEGRIVAGHGRAAACKLLKLTRVPVIEVSHLNETQLRAYALADNRIAEGAGWDSELLAIELKALQPVLADMDLHLDVTGFSAADVDLLNRLVRAHCRSACLLC